MRKLLAFTSVVTFLASATLMADNWPHWRGPSHNGVSTETGLPVSWSAKCRADESGLSNALTPDPVLEMPDGQRGGQRGGGRAQAPPPPIICDDGFETENVSWRLPLPAYSGSTPIIWGNMIFLNVATSSASGDLELWAVDRETQSVAWKRPIAGGNHIERKQNMSSPSPVTDGQHVWIMTGVGVLKAFDFNGTEVWSRSIQDDYV
jgi:outer membrane protein assembly factor BamB